jgi:1-acyl-sn-glycerol-3-phosphate acyltransferase
MFGTFFFWSFFMVSGLIMQLILKIKCMSISHDASKQRLAQHFRLRWSAQTLRFFLGVPALEELKKKVSHLPEQFILISNHRSNLDPLLVAVIARPLVFLSKKSVLKTPVVGRWMRLCGDVSVDRSEKSSREESLNQMRNRLERGDSLLIFPEGTRQTDPNTPLGDFRDGAFNLASQSGVPIVALVLKDTDFIWRKGSFVLDLKPLQFAVSDPIQSVGRDARELKDHAIQTMKNMIQSLTVEQQI